MSSTPDPVADLPPEARAAVERFQSARSRVLLGMLNTPLAPESVDERKRLLADLKTVTDFVAMFHSLHAERAAL